jgi:ABC-type transport system involved in multi-copper enzyme maturation permease subunit
LLTRRTFYALWLLIPGLAFMGACSAKGRKKALGLLLFVVIAGGLLLTPACGSSSSTTNSPTGQTTPKNTYTFTLTGADENGAGPSNSTTAQATVSVTVN